MEEAALACSYDVADPNAVDDSGYLTGLRTAISAALAFGLAGIERGEERVGPIPEALLTQARQAADSGVDLDIVMRRCFAGHALLGDFVFRAMEEGVLTPEAHTLRKLWRTQAGLLDQIVAVMAEEYKSELAPRSLGVQERRLRRVKRLLAGQVLDAQELDYDLEAWHLGAIAAGPGAPVVLRDLAATLDRRLLSVRPTGELLWAWLGGRRSLPSGEFLHVAASKCPPEVSLSLGEPAFGVRGWRHTHRQARAAVPVALKRPPSVVRYIDVALLASALQDDLLASSLLSTYLDPLAIERDGGATLRVTLCAYFAAGRNVSAASAALQVSRQTVNNRLRTVEARIGQEVEACAAELETALKLGDLRPPNH